MFIRNIVMYLIAVNLLAFICFGVDKLKAKTRQWRRQPGRHLRYAYFSP